jgi:hypothetical protein
VDADDVAIAAPFEPGGDDLIEELEGPSQIHLGSTRKGEPRVPGSGATAALYFLTMLQRLALLRHR